MVSDLRQVALKVSNGALTRGRGELLLVALKIGSSDLEGDEDVSGQGDVTHFGVIGVKAGSAVHGFVEGVWVVFSLVEGSFLCLEVEQPHDGRTDDQGIDVNVVFPILDIKDKLVKFAK
jgi:hypothetical protein